MGKFTRELTTAGAIDENTIMVISEETENESFKITLGDMFQGISPFTLADSVAFQDSVGTLTLVGSTGVATLSNGADHSAIQVGDAIIIDGHVNNYVISKQTSPNITLVPSNDISVGASFHFGPPIIKTEDSTSNFTNSISTAGLVTEGGVLTGDNARVGGNLYADGDVYAVSYRSIGGAGYSDIKSEDGVVDIQKNVDDGMITTYYRPSCNAVMTSDQTITASTWTKINFVRIDGADTQQTSFARSPYGASSYDTTNKVFPVPYDSAYSEAIYHISVGVAVNPSAGADDKWYVAVSGASTATSSITNVLLESVKIFDVSSTNRSCLNVSRIVKLHPFSVDSHRYLSVWVWHDCFGGLSIHSASNYTYFSVSCLG